MTNNIFAILAATPATPQNPNAAAIIDIIKKVNVHLNTIII